MINFLSNIFSSKKEQYSTASNLEDADVLYFGKSNTRTRKQVISALAKRNLDTRIITSEDIKFDENEIKIEDVNINNIEEKKVIWRPRTFLEGKNEDLQNYYELSNSEALDFTSNPTNTPLFSNKKKTKKLLQSHGISVPETYNSVEEINEALNKGVEVIGKDNLGCSGRGFEHIDSYVDDIEENKIYEECLDHFQSEDAQDMRMYLVGGKIVSIGERKKNSSEITAKNVANGGYFKEVDYIDQEELDLAEKITKEFGEGIFAVDYIRSSTDEPKVLEINDTPGTKINNLNYEADIFDEIACYLDSSETQYSGVVSEKLLKDIEIVDENSHQNVYNHGLYSGSLSRYSLKDIHRLAAL